jgi:dihydroneopterin aldolase
VGSALVRLRGIRAEGRHGANPGERDAPQEFLVDLDVVLDTGGDSLQDTIDYRIMADMTRSTVAGTSFELLETLAEEVARAVYELSRVVEVTAVVHKPAAAASLGVEDVSAEATLR